LRYNETIEKVIYSFFKNEVVQKYHYVEK